jgi:hypothetical protein
MRAKTDDLKNFIGMLPSDEGETVGGGEEQAT